MCTRVRVPDDRCDPTKTVTRRRRRRHSISWYNNKIWYRYIIYNNSTTPLTPYNNNNLRTPLVEYNL